MTRRARTTAALAALPLLALAACTSGGEDDATDPTSQGPGGETPSGEAPSGETPSGGSGSSAAGGVLTPDGQPDGQPQPVAVEDAGGLDAYLAANSDLAVEVASSVVGDPEADGGTIVVSPASLTTALAIMAAGSGGTTLSEIEDAIGGETDSVLEAIQALRADLEDLDVDPEDIVLDPIPETGLVHMANQVVLADGVQPEQEWLDTIAYRLGAQAVSTGSVEEMQDVLDSWVDLNTGGLIPESGIDASTDPVLVVQDAVLVASAWLSSFAEDATTDDDFHLADGETVQVPTMHDESPMTYIEVDGHRGVELDLAGGLALQVVLPAEGSAPVDITAEQWAEIGAQDSDAREAATVDLALPRVDVETEFGLAGALESSGVVDLFGPAPDLSGMLAGSGYAVDQALQQARLQISEEGVVAAAVTEIAVTESAVQPPERVEELTVDRPFAVRIVDTGTDWVLFHGLIDDPRPDEDGAE
ncbi:MAG: serpin family protein [Actinomycetaceae bacterium]